MIPAPPDTVASAKRYEAEKERRERKWQAQYGKFKREGQGSGILDAISAS